MINVSNEFKETMKLRTDFKENATIELADGTVLELTEKDFTISNNKVVDGASESKIPLGVAICRNIQIEIMNDREQFSIYDFFGAKISLYLTFQLSGSVEKIPFGEFTVNTPGTYGETVIITAIDDMWKTDSSYSTALTYPTTAGAVLQEVCGRCDLLMASASFKNSDFIINEPLSSEYTNRAVIGYIAMIAGGNARINRFGRLEIMSYDIAALDELAIYDGGTFNPWNQTITVDGGTFNPWNTGDVVDGGTFDDRNNIHILYQWKNISVGTDDVVITGIRLVYQDENGEDTSVMKGAEGYVLEVTNPLVAGRESELASLLEAAMIGATFRKFEGDHIAYPLAEFMDPALVVDRKQNVYRTYITDVDFNFLGLTTLKNSAEDALRNSSRYVNDSVKAYIKARKLAVKERTERDKAIEDLAKQLSESSGLFMTTEVQADKSVIYYMHDKATLAESVVIWKLTANALGISTDGGKTYPYGLDASGTAILDRIYAVGLNADYINTGAITIKDEDGNVLFSVDMDTKKVTISGNNVNVDGSTATQAINDALTQSKEYSDEKLADYANAVTADIDNLQAQIDGQVETYYYDYEPTLQNAPASAWTTTEVRAKHIGDIFYWKSKGYAYRFFQDGSTWKWQLVQDTDITQAIAKAENAQDTADGKRRVFVVQPAPPYDIGDLWMQGASGDILTCAVSRSSGSYVSSDWEKQNKYTDDTKAAEALGKFNFEEIFNILTKNGEVKGLFVENGQLYISFTYAKGGKLALGGVSNSNGILEVYDEAGNLAGYWNNNGLYVQSENGGDMCLIKQGYFYFLKDGANHGGIGANILSTAGQELKTVTLRGYGDVIVFSHNNTPYYVINPFGKFLTNNSYAENHYFLGSGRFTEGLFVKEITFPDGGPKIYGLDYDNARALAVEGGVYAYGSIGCSGTKYRVVDTEHYGKVGMNAFETAEPYFSDIGSGEIAEDGTCRIDVDPIFAETIESGNQYQVQLTQTSEEKVSWVEKNDNYFVMHGEPGATFDWMLMCKQKGYADVRLQRIKIQEGNEHDQTS